MPFEEWLELGYGKDQATDYGGAEPERGNEATRNSFAEYVLWTWEDPQALLLDRYPIHQIGVRLWREWHIYGNRQLPRELKDRAWVALFKLFRTVFFPNVSDCLAHLNESNAATERLDAACYMWWDESPYMPEESEIDSPLYLALMRECLFSPRPAIQESAIHGLGHATGWDQSYQPAMRLLEEYWESGVAARPELIDYAKKAWTGRII